jgi:site-specific recombinase XerD
MSNQNSNNLKGVILPKKIHRTISLVNSDFVFYESISNFSNNKRNKLKISFKSTYKDNIWNLCKEHPDLPPQEVTLNFSTMQIGLNETLTTPGNTKYLEIAKEFTYSLITNPPPTYPKWSTCCNEIKNGLKYLLKFMKENGIEKLSEISKHDFEIYHKEIREKPLKNNSPVTNHSLVTRVGSLTWLFLQSDKLSDGLKVWPFGDYKTKTEWCRANAQKVIPKNRMCTLAIPDPVIRELLNTAIRDLKISDQLENINIFRDNLTKNGAKINYHKLMRTGFTWKEFGLESGMEIRNLESRLISACYIIIAIFTGMRFHEIAHLKVDNKLNWETRTIKSNQRSKNIHFVKSMTNKLQSNPTPYLWQTLPIVKEAINALEIGLSWRRKKDNNVYLFAAKNKTSERISQATINLTLKFYVKFNNIKHHDDFWNITTHQFRKTFSRIMIRQGLGLKELQDQLKHFDIEMTKIYGDINLYTELQQEKFIVSQELYDEILSNQLPIIGGGSSEVESWRKEFIGLTKESRDGFLSELPKKALIEQVGDGLCMFRPAKALCGGNIDNCLPADCKNSIIYSKGLLKTLNWRKNENNRLKVFFPKQPLKLAHINNKNLEIDKLINQIKINEDKNE